MNVDDSPATPHKPFRLTILLLAFVTTILILLDMVLSGSFVITYLTPEPSLSTAQRLRLILEAIIPFSFFLITAPAAIFSLITIFRRHRTRGGLLVVVTASLFALAFPLLAPSQSRGREFHGPSISTNAKCIALASVEYASDHAGHFPPHPAVLIIRGDIAPKWLSDIGLERYSLPTTIPPESDWASIATDVDAHSIFIYTAADLVDASIATTAPPLDPAIILLYTRPRPATPRGRIVAFADCRGDYIADADLPRVFAASNVGRAKLGLPPFTLDSPPPTPSLRSTQP